MQEINKTQKVKLLIDFWHRTMMHHAMWLAEVQHQMGREKAFKLFTQAWQKSYEIQMKRLGKILDFQINDGVPQPLLNLEENKIDELLEGSAINWLANDGVWFQTVEFNHNMHDAKRCNDTAWGYFSPFEAFTIKEYLQLGENPGLQGLKKALEFRLYAYINKQSFAEETEKSFVFLMNDCRVQSARKRKNLDDYPCKSGGMVEYTSFAETIDSRIKTQCLCCPPDKHPEEYYCAWKFSID
jgi:hypothetical protein